MKRKISTQLKEAAQAIENGCGIFYSALPDDQRSADKVLDKLFPEHNLFRPWAAETQDVRVLAMCFAAAVVEAEGK